MHVIFDPRAIEYGQGYHPERPARLIAAERLLRSHCPDWHWQRPRMAEHKDILAVHTAGHLGRLSRPIDFDADTPYYPRIERHARRAAGAALEVVDHALDGVKAFSLMRPPGHHATRDRAMGFCYLNSIAIAAFYALGRGCQRVAIWDFDAHHGNGTEAIVHGRPAIRFASIHQYPGYPGTGTESFDNIWNYPVAPHTNPDTHAQEVRKALDKLVEFDPELILVSAGFDGYTRDPITDMTLEKKHFALFGSWLQQLTVPVGAILEGGYSNELPELIESFLMAWEGKG